MHVPDAQATGALQVPFEVQVSIPFPEHICVPGSHPPSTIVVVELAVALELLETELLDTELSWIELLVEEPLPDPS